MPAHQVQAAMRQIFIIEYAQLVAVSDVSEMLYLTHCIRLRQPPHTGELEP